MAHIRKAPWDFEISWFWRGEDQNSPEISKVSATSVPRAINKLKKELQEELGEDYVAADLVVMQVTNLHMK